MPSDDRDRQLERALARHLRDVSPEADCPDAEILAAYHERTLSLEEMARWKDHIVGCVRCQEALALVEETDGVQDAHVADARIPALAEQARPRAASLRDAHVMPATDLPAAGSTPRTGAAVAVIAQRKAHRRLRLLAPVGAVAAGVLVWIAVHEERVAKNPSGVQVAEHRETLPQREAPIAGADKLEKKDQPAAPQLQTRTGDVASKSAPFSTSQPAQSAGRPAAGPAVPAFVPKLPEKDEKTTEEQKESLDRTMASRVATDELARSNPAPDFAAKTPSPAPSQPAPGATVGGARATDRLAMQAAGNNQAVLKQKKAMGAQTELSSEVVPAYQDSASVREVGSVDRKMIVAPGEQQIWIVEPAGKLRHSADGGMNWTAQSTGATADLVAGFAPSPNVVWVVGKAGTILLTTDAGAHWKKLTSPLTGDLGGVHAADALHATVWDTANRKSYETADGGVTWTPVANE